MKLETGHEKEIGSELKKKSIHNKNIILNPRGTSRLLSPHFSGGRKEAVQSFMRWLFDESSVYL